MTTRGGTGAVNPSAPCDHRHADGGQAARRYLHRPRSATASGSVSLMIRSGRRKINGL
ncbi:hypothetical protein ACI2K4_17705 [Micromonospora sp. NPDC050397]|uniref:hypothetical protein n=1 Tax=Micromonospora sp. NPDC050397 TaxID=3364279 RepID=UPI003850A084